MKRGAQVVQAERGIMQYPTVACTAMRAQQSA